MYTWGSVFTNRDALQLFTSDQEPRSQLVTCSVEVETYTGIGGSRKAMKHSPTVLPALAKY